MGSMNTGGSNTGAGANDFGTGFSGDVSGDKSFGGGFTKDGNFGGSTDDLRGGGGMGGSMTAPGGTGSTFDNLDDKETTETDADGTVKAQETTSFDETITKKEQPTGGAAPQDITGGSNASARPDRTDGLGETVSESGKTEYILLGASGGILITGLIFAFLYRRKKL